MPSPIFLVNIWRNAKRRSKATRFTDKRGAPDVFQVGLQNGYYTGMGMSFFFENEADATRFTLWTLLQPAQLIDMFGTEPFRVQGIDKLPWFSGARNQYTGQAERQEAWIVSMEGDRDEELELRFPLQSQAYAFRQQGIYTMQDMLGTLPANPADVSRQLAAFAEQKREAEKIKQQQSTQQPTAGTPPASGGGSSGGSSPPSTPTAPSTPSTPAPPTPSTPQWWSIVAGGAAGRYNGVVYQTGTFLYFGQADPQTPNQGTPSSPTLYNASGFVWSYTIYVTSSPFVTVPGAATVGASAIIAANPGLQAMTPDTQTGRAYVAQHGSSFEWYGIYQPL